MKDTTPQCVRAVLDSPGRYQFIGRTFTWYFEVSDAGDVYQLKPKTMKRDGELSKDGWAPSAEFGTVIPL